MSLFYNKWMFYFILLPYFLQIYSQIFQICLKLAKAKLTLSKWRIFPKILWRRTHTDTEPHQRTSQPTAGKQNKRCIIKRIDILYW